MSLLTGPSGLVVLDLDSESGEQWLRDLAAGRPITGARILKTHNGRHLIFRDGGVAYKSQSGEIADGVDIRGLGGIELIYDPSQRERRFTDLTEPGELPSWLAEVIPLAGSRAPSKAHGEERDSLELDRIIRDGIKPGKHDSVMKSLALSLRNRNSVTRESWPLLAVGILSRSEEGVDASGQVREKFSPERIMGWWDSADAKVRAEEEASAVALAPLPEFPTEAIPGPLRELIEYSPRLPPSTMAGFGLAILAALCGNASVSIPGSEDENAIIWTTVISASGTAKSPSLRRAMAPLQELDSDLLIDPTITVEALARKLANQYEPTGLIASDELKAFLEGIGQYKGGKGADRAKFMGKHSGLAVSGYS